MNKVKYQIFISSTFNDLKEERDQVIKACLEMGHIPVGMEMFSAANEEQWQIITRQIDESDYYILIVANRYGAMVNEVSYTEMEYDYAISQGVPVLGFILDEKAPWPVERAERNRKSQVKLDMFKRKVQRKPVNYWFDKTDLHGKCVVALIKSFNTQPRPGWVRFIEVTPQVINKTTNVYNESPFATAGLIAENASLRLENFKLSNTPVLITYPAAGERVERILTVKGYIKDGSAQIWALIQDAVGYWVQPQATILKDGSWQTQVVIGQVGPADIGGRYQLRMVVNPKVGLAVGEMLGELPNADYQTETIEVIRA